MKKFIIETEGGSKIEIESGTELEVEIDDITYIISIKEV